MLKADLTRPGVWTELFPFALRLMDHLESVTTAPVWSFGGGTVLMLRLAHRQRKDIDLFVPDPQYLGHLNPRLSEVAESVSTDYEEAAEHIRLRRPQGEIDIVVGTPLTDNPFEWVSYQGRAIRVETSAEILAKKMWHRGDRAKVRDLFDIWAVATREPGAIAGALPFVQKRGREFLDAFRSPTRLQREDFDAIDVIGAPPTFEECVDVATQAIEPALGSFHLARPVPAAARWVRTGRSAGLRLRAAQCQYADGAACSAAHIRSSRQSSAQVWSRSACLPASR